MPTRALDFAPLSGEPTAEQLAATREKILRDDRYLQWRRGARVFGIVATAVLTLLVGVPLGLMLWAWADGGFLAPVITDADGALNVGSTLAASITLGVAVAFAVTIFGFGVYSFVGALGSRRGLRPLARLEAFAAANELVYAPRDRNSRYGGRRWDDGTTWRLDHVTPKSNGDVDYGSVGRTGRYGVDETGIGYIAIRVDRRLPHIVLRRGSGFGVVGEGPELKLEGIGADETTLLVPEGYESDALYIFTPDVMAVLLDAASDFDVEIVDDWLFLFTKPLDVADPETHRRVWRIIDAVAPRLRDQTDAYRDDRIDRDPQDPLSPNRVADRGRRLPRTVWIPGVVLGIAVATSPFWGVIAQGIAGAFGR